LRLRTSNRWVDYDLNLYLDIAGPIDEYLDGYLDVVENDFSRADMFDYPVTIDHLLGVGLVAAQVYVKGVIAEHAAPVPEALSLGPLLSSGSSVVQLINHGANFWKHADSWDWESPDWRQARILRELADVGIDGDQHVLFELLSRITGTRRPSLVALSPYLQQWHDAMDDEYPEGRVREAWMRAAEDRSPLPDGDLR